MAFTDSEPQETGLFTPPRDDDPVRQSFPRPQQGLPQSFRPLTPWPQPSSELATFAARFPQANQQVYPLRQPPPERRPDAPSELNPAQLPQADRPSPVQAPRPPQAEWRAPYTPASARGFAHWGTPDWRISGAEEYPGHTISPALPSPMEAIGVIAGAGRQMRQWGAPGVGQFAGRASELAMQLAPVLDRLSKGQFSKNYWAANNQRLRAQHEEMVNNAEQAVYNQALISQAFGKIFSDYKFGAIDQETAEHQIEELAMRTNHQSLVAVMKNMGLAGVEKYLDHEDAKMRDLWAGAASARKARDTDTADEGVLTKSGGEGEGRPLPGPADAPVEKPVIGPTEGGAKPSDLDTTVGKRFGLTPEGVDKAKAAARGDGTLTGYSKNARPRLDNAANAFSTAAQKAAAEPGTQDEKIGRLRQIDPQLASRVEGLLNYETDPKSMPVAGGSRERTLGLARLVNPGFKEGFYNIAQKYRDPTSKIGSAMTRQNAYAQAQASLLAATSALPDQRIPRNILDQMTAQFWTGDPKYATLHQAIRNFATETVAIQMGTGTPRVTLVNDLIKHMTITDHPAQILAGAQVDARNTVALINNANEQWGIETGQKGAHAPGWSPAASSIMGSFMRMNPFTGEVDKDAPDMLKAYSRKLKPSWLRKGTGDDPGQDFTPMTQAQFDQAKAFLDRYRNDPDPDVQRKLQYLRKLMGPTP